MNTPKLLYGIFAIAVLSLAACSNDSSDDLYEGVDRTKIRIDNVDRTKIILKDKQEQSVDRTKIIIKPKGK